MKKTQGTLKPILFILPVILLLLLNSFYETSISYRVLGKWKYVSHLYRGVGRYGQEEVVAIKTSVLNFEKNKIYFSGVTFIDTCFYTEFLPKAFFDRDYQSSHYLLDGPLAIKYSEEKLSKFVRLDFNCKPNGFGTFYLNGDTVILNSTGGVTFFFTKVKPCQTRLFARVQETELIDGIGFLSCFSKMEEGSFKGTMNGILNLITTRGDSLSVNSFSND
jgi:hypothetical protein